MQKKLEEFYLLFRADKIELDAVELAEIIWLAQQIEEHRYAQPSLAEMFQKRLDDMIDSFKALFQKRDKVEKKERNNEEALVSNQKKKRTKRIAKSVESVPLVGRDGGSSNRLSLRVSTPKSLESTAWRYALRHFKQKKPMADKTLFDEEKTADYIASHQLFIPQYRAKSEKRFEVVFIVDVSDSMEIWQELSDEFFKSIKNYGIFKNITLYYMHSNNNFTLYKSKDKRVKVKKEWYKHLSTDTLCFVLTDMLSTSWYSGAWLSTFDKWQKHVALSVIQMLPYHLWRGTVINHAQLTKLEGHKAFGKNRYLKSKARFGNSDEKLLKLPILNLDVESFDQYGKVFLAKSKQRIDGAIFSVDEVHELRKRSQKASKTDEERVEHFYRVSSEPAQQLAEYFSVIPLSFSVMKIVQKLFLKNSTQVHLSELFMSGLINKEAKEGTLYSFYKSDSKKEGVRDILLNLLGTSKAVDAIVKISNYVSMGEGAFNFLAFLQDPNYLESSNLSSEFDREFARISVALLEKMGGEYAQRANELAEFMEYDEEELEEEEIKIITPFSKRYKMGLNKEEREQPIHEVVINYDFEISAFPVTVEEFSLFVEDSNYITQAEKEGGAYIWDGKEYTQKKDASWKKPYFKQSHNHPVVCVSWNDAQAYIAWLNSKIKEHYRLPTEAEWEFACRAGTETQWHFGDNEKELEEYAWYGRKGGDGTKEVGTKKPNPWGLYDMHGNVWEWCEDDFVDNYKNTPTDGSTNIEERKKYKSLRGGSWDNYSFDTRSTVRVGNNPTVRVNNVGFRLLRTLP